MDLGALTRRVHEEVAVARQRISREPLTHERAEPVEAFAQVGRRAVRPDGDLSRGADHPSARSTATSVSGSSPSTRMPSGVMSTGPATARALWRGASGPTSTARMTAADGFRSHRASVHGATPISRAIAGTFAPAARRRRAIAVTCWRSALGYRTAVGGRPCRSREISARILRTRSSMLAPPFIVGVSMPREAGQRLDGETRGVTDYQRNGLTSLYAALEVASGRVIGDCAPRHTGTDFLRFIQRVARRYRGRELHVVLDNSSTHSTPAVQAWLAQHPAAVSLHPQGRLLAQHGRGLVRHL